ncbi:MAG: hypothetical protein [Caudoviricetes sp.]|nr:MAG: hypothetical protein [Caudoviricetes sp.]
MPIPVKPTVPPIPQRTQEPALFSDNVDAFLTFIPDAVDYFDEATTFTDERAVSADSSASSAALSQSSAAASSAAAAASSNYKGEWLSLSGALNKPATVSHNGAFWVLVNNLANVALSEPGVTADWLFNNGTRWSELITSSATLSANQLAPVLATVGNVDLTQPAFSAGDFLIIHNSPASTDQVRLLNPSNTIIGKRGAINSGDNVIIQSGDAVHLYARSSSILEVV